MSLALDICARNLAKAKQLAGIEKTIQTAEQKQEGFIDLAVSFVAEFCKAHQGECFMAEDIRDAYAKAGRLTPPDDRMFGAVMQRAAAKGYIRKIGYAPSVSSNGSPKTQWLAL